MNLDNKHETPKISEQLNPNMASSTNSETLKKFYDQLISNTPTGNSKPGMPANPNIRSAFDVICHIFF